MNACIDGGAFHAGSSGLTHLSLNVALFSLTSFSLSSKAYFLLGKTEVEFWHLPLSVLFVIFFLVYFSKTVLRLSCTALTFRLYAIWWTPCLLLVALDRVSVYLWPTSERMGGGGDLWEALQVPLVALCLDQLLPLPGFRPPVEGGCRAFSFSSLWVSDGNFRITLSEE